MFRFLKDDDNSDMPDDVEDPKSDLTARPITKIAVSGLHTELASKVPHVQYTYNKANDSIKYIAVGELLQSEFLAQNETTKKLINSSTDLISGEYEGGFKIWECTMDLIKYMESNVNISLCGKRVLDLGCGSGLLGLYALAKGASVVDFQDYNWEVLEYLTAPNAVLNFGGNEIKSKCHFYGGDWISLEVLKSGSNNKISHVDEGMYDIILTSETIYNVKYLPRLCSLLSSCLKPDGVILLAAKTVYFGVGGGTHAFRNEVSKNTSMRAEVVETIKSGVQREIMQLQRNN